MKEKRFDERIRCATPAILISDNVIYLDCVIRNISSTGIAVEISDHSLNRGRKVKLLLGKSNQGISLSISTKLIHITQEKIGLALDSNSRNNSLNMEAIQKLSRQGRFL